MSLHHGLKKSSSSHLRDLRSELDNIYYKYSTPQDNGSEETLDLVENQVPSEESLEELEKEYRTVNLPEVRISSRLSSLEVIEDRGNVKSAPLTPSADSTESFDFNPRPRNAQTNSSLNVLLDTPMDSELDTLARLLNERTTSGSDLQEPTESNEASSDKDWNERGAAVGKVKENDGTSFRVIKRNVQDFEFGRTLGEGSYSTVVLAADKHSSKRYAVKILDKRHIIKEKKVKYVNIEKHALNRLCNGPGIISLYFTFQDKDSLYFVLDYASNGELLTLIKKYNTLNEDCVRHFGAQILDAIRYMHNNGVIHRDIKPENILLDSKMRIKITDFGTAKLLDKKGENDEEYPLDVRANSFVGTAEYVSPELLESKYCGKPGDIWAFGCIIYQMIAGKPPFKAPNEYLTFQKITKLQYAFSAGFPTIIRDLIKKILVLQPSRRLSIPQIQEHYFFATMDWSDEDLIWERPHPELGPYKVNANSMKKLPDLVKNVSVPKLSKKTNPSQGTKKESVENGSVNPASAAAFVLNKGSEYESVESSDSTSDSNPKTSSSSKSPLQKGTDTPGSVSRRSVPNYIPGTKILRPTIHNRGSFASVTTNRKKRANPPKLDALEVKPMNSIDIAWSDYLNHADERILKMGPVICTKQPTDLFERKNKGLLHDSPLGFANKLQASRGGSTTFLSQIIQNSNVDWRNALANSDESQGNADESKAVTTYNNLDEDDSSIENGKKHGDHSEKKGKSIFKKLLSSQFDKGSDQEHTKSNGDSENGSFKKESRPHTCVLLITTHGRALILLRSKSKSKYKIAEEIKLTFPFIRFKEVVSSNSKVTTLPTTGVFAIESSQTTFVFEVEKYDLTSWTESLAKSKLNQHEREALAKEVMVKEVIAKEHAGSKSPKKAEKSSSSHKGTRQSEAFMKQRAAQKPKRKPPPGPAPHSGNLDPSTGLGIKSSDNGVTGMLQAAQLAVSSSSHPTTVHAHSSFTKDLAAKFSPYMKHSLPPASNGHPPAHVTALNSKFLARSQRKK